jgi:galactose mutarotase-like enzyme
MKLWKGIYKGLEAFFMENEKIQLATLPDLGAKIASLIYKPQDFEIASQPSEERYRKARFGDPFELYDTSGFDDCFPTIDPCDDMVDHGELWSQAWEVRQVNDSLTCSVEGIRFSYRFERTIELHDSSVILSYRVTNLGREPLLALWAFHGLINADELTKILISANKVINVHKSPWLGKVGQVHSYPKSILIDGRLLWLDRFDPKAKRTEKYYAYGRLEKGEAALTLNHGRLLYKLAFPENTVPYLGIWLNERGLREGSTCALEPSTAFYDSPEIAEKNGSIDPLASGKNLVWTLIITLEPLREG